jgi:hypothetical protein
MDSTARQFQLLQDAVTQVPCLGDALEATGVLGNARHR